MSKTRYFIFQALFFTATFFLLHFALFDFYSTYKESSELFYKTFENWLWVLIFDLFVGLMVGLIISAFSVAINNNHKSLRNLIIVTDLVWLTFCFVWYFNNKGGINIEAIGHVISPIIVGFVGGILAILNLIISLVANKNLKQT
jgi:heme A synthase